jgi:hypothetical protein
MKKNLPTISERVIEDIFIADKRVLAEVLSLDYSDLSLLARQNGIKSVLLMQLHRSLKLIEANIQ